MSVVVVNSSAQPVPVTGSLTAVIGAGSTVTTLTGSVVAIDNFPATQDVSGSVSVSNFPSFPATQTVDGSVGVNNFPVTQTVDGSVNVNNFPSTYAVSNFPSSQTVSGTVGVSNFPATQPVSGTLSVGNFPASQTINGAVSVSNFPSSFNVGNLPVTQAVSGTVSVGNFPSTQGVSGTVNVGNFPATQPVSGTVYVGGTITSLPIFGLGPHCYFFADGTGSMSNGGTRMQSYDAIYNSGVRSVFRVFLNRVSAAANVLTTVAGAIIGQIYITVSDNTISPGSLAVVTGGSTLVCARPPTCDEYPLALLSAQGGLGAAQAGLATTYTPNFVDISLGSGSTMRVNVYVANQYSTGTGTVNYNFTIGLTVDAV